MPTVINPPKIPTNNPGPTTVKKNLFFCPLWTSFILFMLPKNPTGMPKSAKIAPTSL